MSMPLIFSLADIPQFNSDVRDEKLTNDGRMVDLSAMRTLLYASPSAGQRNRITALAEQVSDRWNIVWQDLPGLNEVSMTPDIAWVNFGPLPSGEPPRDVLSALGKFQAGAQQPAMIVVSGQMPEAAQKSFFEHLFTFVRPEGVEFDFVGMPNPTGLVFFEAKLDALRNHPAAPLPAAVASKIMLPATADLREANGNLSAKRIAEAFDVKLTQLADWLGRSKQALSKTPDADSLQRLLGPFEQIAAVRTALGDTVAFRKWLRSPHRVLQNKAPLDWIARGRVRAVAEFAEDMLTGNPA
jgi:hypothetical protein